MKSGNQNRTVLMLLCSIGSFNWRRQSGAQRVASARGWKLHIVIYAQNGAGGIRLECSPTGSTVAEILKYWHPDGCITESPLSPAEAMPVTGCEPLERDVSPLMFRKGRWALDKSLYGDFGFRAAMEKTTANGGMTTVMPLHVWPMAPGSVSFEILAQDVSTNKCAVIVREGFQEGFSLNLLEDGRLEAVWSGGCKGPVWKQEIARTYALESRRPIRDGQWHRVVLENDLRKIRIVIDGELDAERDAEPFRAYGRCTVVLPQRPECRIRNLEIGVAGNLL